MKNYGVSLLEVNVCLAIVAIVSLVAFPCLSGIRESISFRRELQTLYGSLQRAKIEAIKKNRQVVFLPRKDGYTIFVDDGDGGAVKGDWVRQGSEKILTSHYYCQGVWMRRSTFPLDRTRFSGTGIGMRAGRVVLTNRSGALAEVFVSIVGRIRVARKS